MRLLKALAQLYQKWKPYIQVDLVMYGVTILLIILLVLILS